MKSYVCITGAAGGLGKAFAAECASRGWNLFLTDLMEEPLIRLSEGLSATYGVEIEYYPCDLTNPESRAEMLQEIKDRGICFWSLINVAGIDYEGLFEEKTLNQIRTILRLNIESTVEITRSILEIRDRVKPFMLITVSSLAAYYPMPVKALYAASKRFLLDFSLALREEIRSMGGTVTVLCPAGMPTTELNIRAIDAQGIMGRLTTKDVGFVAARTIDHGLKGHAIYVPGLLNRMLRFLGGLVPSTFLSYIIGRRWAAAHRKSCGSTNI